MHARRDLSRGPQPPRLAPALVMARAHCAPSVVEIKRGRVAHTGELLYDIAVALWQAISSIQPPSSPWPAPRLDDFNQSWYASFNHFIRGLDAHRHGRRLILTIDEFEIIEQLINDG